jgi:hypothetical protein
MRFVYVAASALSLAALFPNAGSAQGFQFIPVTPCRVADTRNPNGAFGGPEMTPGSTRTFNVPMSSCSIPSNAAAYALNVTVVPDASLNYLTIWPAGQNQPFVSTLNSDGRIKANAAIVPAGTSGGISVFVTDQTQVIIDINGYFVPDGTANALQFFPLTPCRVADTRSPNGNLGGPFIPAGVTRQFPILSSCGLPGNASAFSLNFTAVPHGPLAFITVWPSDQNQPLASTLNASTGAITANAAIVPGAAGSGQVSVFASNDTDLVIDINGYFAPPANNGLELFNLTPCRVLDTRSNNGQPFNGAIPVNVAASGCGAPGNAQAFVLNATVVPPGALTFLTLWPDGQQQPFVSTLNALDGAITSNMAIVPTGNGSIDAFGSNPTQLIVDISGYFAPNNNGGSGTPPPPPCPGPPCAFIDSASVGNNLQAFVNINLSPAPSANTAVTVFTDRPDLVAISGSASEAGGSTFTYVQPAGTSNIAVFVQGLASSGTAHIWAAPADTTYGSSIGAVTLFPSAFVLFSPNGIGGSIQVGEFGSATLTVSSARLDASGNFVTVQQVRGLNVNGTPPASTPTVSLSVNSSVGVVSPSSLAFAGGTDSMSTQFTASGNANAQGPVTANQPPGFSIPANGANQVNVTVTIPTLTCTSSVAVAFNLATQASCFISVGAAPVDEAITLTSNSPGALLLSPNLLTPGAASITVTIRQGFMSTAPFYLIGAANSGTATYNATSALGNYSATVTLLRSGFVLSAGAGAGGTFSATFPGPDVSISVIPVSLDGSGSPLLAGQLAPGISASVNVSSSNTSVGTIVGSPVTLNGGDTQGVVTFHPTAAGTTNISASASGYTTPSSGATVGAIVGTPRILVTPPATPVGQNLEVQTTAILSAPPSSNLTVTLAATGSIKFSATGTDAGASTLNITVPAGQQSFLFYVYGQASSGTATITATASGFNTGTASVTLGPSGFVIMGPFGAAPVFQTPKAAGPQQLAVQPAVLDSSNNFITTQNLAGSKGAVTVNISNTNTSAGTLPTSVTVPVGAVGIVTFTPVTSGQQTAITLAQPSGFVGPVPNGANPGGSLTVVVE